jgi:hypothetical protein
MEEVEECPVFAVGRDEGAAALVPKEDALGHELVDRLANGAYGNAEASGEPRLARYRFTGLPFPGGEAAREARLHLLVEGAQREARGGERFAAAVQGFVHVRGF